MNGAPNGARPRRPNDERCVPQPHEGHDMRLTPDILPAVQRALAELGVDGWLLYDLRGTNPIAGELLGLHGLVSRRVFAYIPRSGVPVALTHAIEQGPWADWPKDWKKIVYSGWRVFETELATMIAGKRVAMEYASGDAIPYLDRIPAGVIELVRASGATDIVSSGDLVTQFFAGWSEQGFASHKRAAEAIAAIAKEVMRELGRRARGAKPATEYEGMELIREAFAARKLVTDHGPNVSVGASAANPHYEPTAEVTAIVKPDSVLLIDLWAHEDGGIWADQTWMAWIGDGAVPPDVQRVWEAVRDARDAAAAHISAKLAAKESVRGADADDAARAVIAERGYSNAIWHRTGHSIDPHALHGSGPNIDNLETREERRLIRGSGFSIEPGLYFPGRFGVRSEVNGIVWDTGLVITPNEIQQEMLRV
jgi:Xaa-Pro aminopeptidase